MKVTTGIILFLTLLVVLALPGTALAAGQGQELRGVLPDEFVLGDNFILESGESVHGNLWVMGGNADLRSGSRVTGSIMLFGGNLRANGLVEGHINAAGGNLEIGDTAVVRGDVNLIGGSLDRSQNARIEGDINEGMTGPFTFTTPRGVRIPAIDVRLAPLWDLLSYLFQSFLMAALAVLVVMFLPAQTARVARTAVSQPLPSGGLGLLTVLVVPAVMLLLAITIILIPASLLTGLLLGIVIVFGWIAIGLEVGQRMAGLFRTEWAPPVAAGLGTLALSIVIGGIGKYLWCVGWLAPTLVALVGVGSVLLTRFGMQPYPPHGGLPPAPPAPVVPTTPGAETDIASSGGARAYPVDEGTPGDEPPPAASTVGVYPLPKDEPPA